MAELVFEVFIEADGGYTAKCVSENIFTQGDTWEELRQNVIEATRAHHFDSPGREWAMLEDRRRKGDRGRYLAVLDRVPDVEPEPQDRL